MLNQNQSHEDRYEPRPSGDVIHMLVSWANLHDAIRALLLTSTRAIPSAQVDLCSDYDVILIVQDIHPLVANHTWLNDFGEVLIAYWDPIQPDPIFGIEVCSSVIQYTHGLKIDFTLWPVGLLQQIAAAPPLPPELDAGYQVLLDKDHLTDGMHPPTGKAYIPKKPTSEEYHLLINDFLSDAPYVAKCLWRGELMPAKWCLDFDMKHIYLRRMLEWHLEIDHGWSVPVGSLGKGLRKHLPPDIWTALEQTYAGAQIEANWEALRRTMGLFRQVSTQVGDYFGFAYPDDLHQKVRRYVDHIHHIAPPDHT
jgi:aminoglycoside 6-adenylyltransferase